MFLKFLNLSQLWQLAREFIVIKETSVKGEIEGYRSQAWLRQCLFWGQMYVESSAVYTALPQGPASTFTAEGLFTTLYKCELTTPTWLRQSGHNCKRNFCSWRRETCYNNCSCIICSRSMSGLELKIYLTQFVKENGAAILKNVVCVCV